MTTSYNIVYFFGFPDMIWVFLFMVRFLPQYVRSFLLMVFSLCICQLQV